VSALPERDEVFEERIRLAPKGCHVLADGPDLHGYAISHPWRRARPPPLDEFIGALPPQSDCWLIHDLALRPGVRGAGFAARIVEELAAVARADEFSVMALVALGGAAPFWRRAGFADAGPTVPKDKLRSYGDDAVYMERAV
jgi:GNAT superfamily N-acetyltransferase